MATPRLELRLLGGFEVRLGSEPVTSFESQKARALLAYLVLHRGRALERDALASLLWGERSDESARRNLRQALYSIRSSVSSVLGAENEIVSSTQRELRLDPEIECWVDVEQFEAALEAGTRGEAPDPRQLSIAAQLYKGDFLAGFYLRECPDFEAWQITRQEELREGALDTFRTLVDVYVARGEHRYGIRYAKRLLALDPLSEVGHRQLMRLFVMAGRRTRALAQYEHLLNLMREELGVEPMEETTDLYRSILLATHGVQDAEEEDDATPPLVPLVGRTEEFSGLQEEWEQVVGGAGRLSWITGEAGIGKSRLAKTFVDAATSKRHAIVLRGHCYAAAATVAYRSISELLGSALHDVVPDEEMPDGALESTAVTNLRQLAAASGQMPATDIGDDHAPTTTPAQVASELLEVIDLLCRPGAESSRPVIVLFEDFQWADAASRRVLDLLTHEIVERAIWILVTCRDDSLAADVPLLSTARHFPLERLSEAAVAEIASSIVDMESSPIVADYLWRYSEGLPLRVAELVNLLWDERLLRPVRPGVWELGQSPVPSFDEPPSTGALVQRRVRALPTSARRLLAVAAVYGHQFDVEILQAAADEHLTVVETGVELALERWLIRQFPRSWSPAGLEKDIVLWARGARRGYFEFSHDQVRLAVLDQINPIRRAVIHRDLAVALEAHHGSRSILFAEDLAYHWLAAQEPERALPWLEAAALRAARGGADGLKRDYVDKALEVVSRLERDGRVRKTGLLEATKARLEELETRDG